MNKFKFTLALIVGLIPILLFSQITIDHNDMPQEGDTIRLSSSFDFGSFNYTATGNNYTWDFSSLTPFSQSVDTFESVDMTPWVYQLVFWGSANLVQPLQSFDLFQGFELSDIYDFYNNTEESFQKTGSAVTISEIPLPNKYQEPDVIYSFPVEPGNMDSSMSSYEFDLPGLGYSGGWKKRINQADGWGTLITPYGSFETIRIKSTVTQFDSLYIDTTGVGVPILRNYTEYKWLGKDFGLPLCKITEEGIIKTVSYIDSVRSVFVGIENQSIVENKLSIYPNPTSDHINIEFTLNQASDVDVQIVSITGRVIQQFSLKNTGEGINQHSIPFKVLEIDKGVYFIVIRTNKHILSKKLMIE